MRRKFLQVGLHVILSGELHADETQDWKDMNFPALPTLPWKEQK